ncbi:DUF6301 family protein [Streptomyces anulatus]|uniref:Uncharacterized protein n=1 Tax=Streptomyces anulatus TaxID=1892 RepID=A0A7K3RBW7_STRAQ|nr:DUF6301 family protein [Streptomyces anulatus]NEB99648.1 hypothetical protein [Streptomyces anulatus]NED26802.1 hypothetical protein [Streptomyces anulatus]
MIRRLTGEQVVDLALRLDGISWNWTTSEIAEVLRTSQLIPLDSLDNPSIPIEHPDLTGVRGFVVNLSERSIVLEINVTLTEVSPREDIHAQSEMDAAFQEYLTALISTFGDPDDYPKESVIVWDRGEEKLKLRRLGIAVDLSRESNEGIRIYNNG